MKIIPCLNLNFYLKSLSVPLITLFQFWIHQSMWFVIWHNFQMRTMLCWKVVANFKLYGKKHPKLFYWSKKSKLPLNSYWMSYLSFDSTPNYKFKITGASLHVPIGHLSSDLFQKYEMQLQKKNATLRLRRSGAQLAWVKLVPWSLSFFKN